MAHGNKMTLAMQSASHEAEHAMAAHAPVSFDFKRAAVAGFDWKTLIGLAFEFGAFALPVVLDVVNGMSRQQLLEKYGSALHMVIDAVLARFKGPGTAASAVPATS